MSALIKFTASTRGAVIAAVKIGVTLEAAATTADVDRITLRRWLRQGADDEANGLDGQPAPKQQDFHDDNRLELLYGGAAGSGKTVAQLAAALKYVHIPGYSAVLIRRSYSHLTMPGAFIPLSREWLGGKADYNTATHTWPVAPEYGS